MAVSFVLCVLAIFLYRKWNERDRARQNAKTRDACLTNVHHADYRANKAPKCDYKEGGGKEYEICLAKYRDGDRLGVLPCNHHFHEECIKEWIRVGVNTTCPICKDSM